ncbi:MULTISPECIES: hypothetical protein [Cysteiniphilum]|uniref:Type VI secretion system protein ImpL n=1 Tax=Cysteiniphilum litorale TaxID=2056700 RepID=A0A8J2Z6P5_9GAMM|nr:MULTISPECIES: hypothetical protein [Cysteiniphilum]GGG07087.1 hypothetical protein GCM10010995_25730 [Cysteiniphilum litorale]
MSILLTFLKNYGTSIAIVAVIIVMLVFWRRYKKYIKKLVNFIVSISKSIFRSSTKNRYLKGLRTCLNRLPANVYPGLSNKQPYLLLNFAQDQFVIDETGLGELIAGNKSSINKDSCFYLSNNFVIHELHDLDQVDFDALEACWLKISQKTKRIPIVVVHDKLDDLTQKKAMLVASSLNIFAQKLEIQPIVSLSFSMQNLEGYDAYQKLSMVSEYIPIKTISEERILDANLMVKEWVKLPLQYFEQHETEIIKAVGYNVQKVGEIHNFLQKVLTYQNSVEHYYAAIISNSPQSIRNLLLYMPRQKTSYQQNIFSFVLSGDKKGLNINYPAVSGYGVGVIGVIYSSVLLANAIGFQAQVDDISNNISYADTPLNISQLQEAYRDQLASNPSEYGVSLLPQYYISKVLNRAYSQEILSKVKALIAKTPTETTRILMSYLFVASHDDVRKIIQQNKYVWQEITDLNANEIDTVLNYAANFDASDLGKIVNSNTSLTGSDNYTVKISDAYFKYLLSSSSVTINDWQRFIEQEFLPLVKVNLLTSLSHTDNWLTHMLYPQQSHIPSIKTQISKSDYQHLNDLIQVKSFKTYLDLPTTIDSLSQVVALLNKTQLMVGDLKKHMDSPLQQKMVESLLKARVNSISAMVVSANNYDILKQTQSDSTLVSFQNYSIPLIYTKEGLDQYVVKIIGDYKKLSTSLGKQANMNVLDTWQKQVVDHYTNQYIETYTNLMSNLLMQQSKGEPQYLIGIKNYLTQISSIQVWQLIYSFYNENTKEVLMKDYPFTNEISNQFTSLNAFLSNQQLRQQYVDILSELATELSQPSNAIIKITKNELIEGDNSYSKMLSSVLKQQNIPQSLIDSLLSPVHMVVRHGVKLIEKQSAQKWQKFTTALSTRFARMYPFSPAAKMTVNLRMLNDLLLGQSSLYKSYFDLVSPFLIKNDSGEYVCKKITYLNTCPIDTADINAINQLQSLIIDLEDAKGNPQSLPAEIHIDQYRNITSEGQGIKYAFVNFDNQTFYGINTDIGWLKAKINWWQPLTLKVGIILNNGQVYNSSKNYVNGFALLQDYAANQQNGKWKVMIPKTGVNVDISLKSATVDKLSILAQEI